MDTLLVLNANPEVEDDLLDYLLELDCVSGFTSYPVRGHGRHEGRRIPLSLAEQVTGRRKRVLVEILLEAAAVPEVLGGLRDRVGTDIIWWQLPVQGFGRIS